MYVYDDNSMTLADWIRAELSLGQPIGVGAEGMNVRRVQEWLTLSGYPLPVDGKYGVATADTVVRFQTDAFLPATGKVDEETFQRLTAPMDQAVQQRLRSSQPLGDAIATYAQTHLKMRPQEVGGQNRGPWVRLYMRGRDGADWPWCAGFVTFVMNQAAESMEAKLPIDGSFSCDTLAAQAREKKLFLSERDVSDVRMRKDKIKRGSLFLNRRTETDWTHMGVVVEANELTITTIEGNTNDDGSREGYEVCMRTRSYANRDFIVFK